jgi:hypothetical protein
MKVRLNGDVCSVEQMYVKVYENPVMMAVHGKTVSITGMCRGKEEAQAFLYLLDIEDEVRTSKKESAQKAEV